MRKLIISLTLAALLTLSTALVAFADPGLQGENTGAQGGENTSPQEENDQD